MTKDPNHFELLINALNNAQQFVQHYQLLSDEENLRKSSDFLQYNWAWALFRKGKFKECDEILKTQVRLYDSRNRYSLSIQLAISSGKWERINDILENEYARIDEIEPNQLLILAQLSQRIGYSKEKEFVKAAVLKAPDNPEVNATAYFIAVNGGWENDATDATKWLSNAIQDSKENNGPLKNVSLKELMKNQKSWNKTSNEISQKLNQGEIPIYIAATQLNRSVVDFLLQPAYLNCTERDPRKRINIYAFSGAKEETQEAIQKLGLDVTAIMTMSYLGILPEVLASYEQITIAHQTLDWFFDEYANLNFHQPSRLAKAKSLSDLRNRSIIKQFHCSTDIDPHLVSYIGKELAELFAESDKNRQMENNQQLIVHPCPIFVANSFMDEVADLKERQQYVCSCWALVDKLLEKGLLTSFEEEHVRNYLLMQGKGWNEEPKIEDNATIYIDDISLSFLLDLGIIEKLHDASLKIYLRTDEADELIQNDRVKNNIKIQLRQIKEKLEEGIDSGKINVASGILDRIIEKRSMFPTLGLANLSDIDAIIIDDRFFNSPFMLKNESPNYKLLTTLDVLKDMSEKGFISKAKLFDCYTRLRQAGFILIPIDFEEIQYYLEKASINGNDTLIESAELKAIRENILKIRMSGLLSKYEYSWYDKFTQMIYQTIRKQWTIESIDKISSARSNWLLDLLHWRGNNEASFDDMKVVLLARAFPLLPLIFFSKEIKLNPYTEAYLKWIDDRLEYLKSIDLRAFRAMAQYIRNTFENIIANDKNLQRKNVEKSELRNHFIGLLLSIPKVLRSEILSDHNLSNKYNFQMTSKISINPLGEFDEIDLIESIKESFKTPFKDVFIYDNNGNKWKSQDVDLKKGKLSFCSDNEQFELAGLAEFLPYKQQRIDACINTAKELNIPSFIAQQWIQKLDRKNISSQEILDIIFDIQKTPSNFVKALTNYRSINITPDLLCPKNLKYYERLVGYGRKSDNVLEYSDNEGKRHIDNLLKWDKKCGLEFALLLSSHESLLKCIDINSISKDDIIEILKNISHSGDRYSQLGLIELFFGKLPEYPEISEYICDMLDQIFNDDPQDIHGQYWLLAALITLIGGQVAKEDLFVNKKTFWRRLAVTAQASLAERHLIKYSFDRETFHRDLQADRSLFYLQVFYELKEIPLWTNGYVNGNALKGEFLGRILKITSNNEEIVESIPRLKKLLDDNKQKFSFLALFMPGPLEQRNDRRVEVTSDIERLIQESLGVEKLEVDSFIPVINISFLCKINSSHAELIVDALRRVNYQIFLSDDSLGLSGIVEKLAVISATTRSSCLAEELRVLIRNLKYQHGEFLSKNELFSCAFITAAAFENKDEWKRFFGDWCTEIAFSELSKEEARLLSQLISLVCQIAPELWKSLDRADAALSAYIFK